MENQNLKHGPWLQALHSRLSQSRLSHRLCLTKFGIHTLLLGEACIAAAKTFAHGPNGISNGTLSTCWEHALLGQSFDVSSQYLHHREFLACALSMVRYLVQVRHCGLPPTLYMTGFGSRPVTVVVVVVLLVLVLVLLLVLAVLLLLDTGLISLVHVYIPYYIHYISFPSRNNWTVKSATQSLIVPTCPNSRLCFFARGQFQPAPIDVISWQPIENMWNLGTPKASRDTWNRKQNNIMQLQKHVGGRVIKYVTKLGKRTEDSLHRFNLSSQCFTTFSTWWSHCTNSGGRLLLKMRHMRTYFVFGVPHLVLISFAGKTGCSTYSCKPAYRPILPFIFLDILMQLLLQQPWFLPLLQCSTTSHLEGHQCQMFP